MIMIMMTMTGHLPLALPALGDDGAPALGALRGQAGLAPAARVTAGCNGLQGGVGEVQYRCRCRCGTGAGVEQVRYRYRCGIGAGVEQVRYRRRCGTYSE